MERVDEGRSTALAVREAAALPLASLADIQSAGEMLAKSGMFGPCTAARGATILSTCMQERISFLEFKQRYHVTEHGQITMRSDRMLAEFQARGGKCVWEEYSATRAAARFSYRENQDVLIESTIEDAQRAGLTKQSNYTKHPAAMLRARLISGAVRMLCPAATLGMYAPEELDENDEPRMSFSTEEAERRAAAATTPFAEVVEDEPQVEPVRDYDYSTCPMNGPLYGKPWADMEPDVLQYALRMDSPDMEPQHYEAVREALAAKAEGGSSE